MSDRNNDFWYGAIFGVFMFCLFMGAVREITFTICNAVEQHRKISQKELPNL